MKNKLWAIGGGKGGVGKSIVTVLIGAMLARLGKKVILVDADLGGSNLHTLLGIKYPTYTLSDFIRRRVNKIENVVMDTPVNNLMLICGADDILGLANPKNNQKTRIFNHLKKLSADFILLDLGAGTSFTTVDFFLYAPNKIVVLTPQTTSIQNAYGFIKSCTYRKISQIFSKDYKCLEIIKNGVNPGETEMRESIDELRDAFWSIGEEQYNKLNSCLKEFKIDIIVNMVKKRQEINVGRVLKSVADNYLSLNLEYPGYINYDMILEKSINNMAVFLTNCSNSVSGGSFYDIACKILKQSHECRDIGTSVSFPIK